MCTQTGLNPNKRTAVALFAWVVVMRNGAEMTNYWIDVSECGLEQAMAYQAQMVAEADHSGGAISFPISQYHVYYHDGGHGRPRSKNDLMNVEKSSNHYYPEMGAKILTPTPEYWIQEGITENPNYVAPV